jgi:ATP-dependent Clp protease ATP-binding subunit ClpB
VLQQRVENVLAQRILSGEFSAGDRVRVDAVGEGDARELRFERISEPAVA